MEFETEIWSIIVAIGGFVVLGAVLLVRAFQRDIRAEAGDEAPVRSLTLHEGVRRYVGPVSPEMALLKPWSRVLLEAVGCVCGLPGFGWLASTRVAIGLPLLLAGGSIIYGFYPALLAATGHLADRPLIAFEYLPYLAAISATALAVAEFRAARRARSAA